MALSSLMLLWMFKKLTELTGHSSCGRRLKLPLWGREDWQSQNQRFVDGNKFLLPFLTQGKWLSQKLKAPQQHWFVSQSHLILVKRMKVFECVRIRWWRIEGKTTTMQKDAWKWVGQSGFINTEVGMCCWGQMANNKPHHVCGVGGWKWLGKNSLQASSNTCRGDLLIKPEAPNQQSSLLTSK